MAEPILGCRPSRKEVGFIMAVLIAAMMLGAIDRQIVALLVVPLKVTFAIGDTWMGFYQGAAARRLKRSATLRMASAL